MPTPISRDELVALLEHDEVILIEALPVAHYTADHLPGASTSPVP
ncbi:hypothetical protein [Cellulomonas sp. APG4]|nr:hypothetical protein [Cellulomonas sp. APG4]